MISATSKRTLDRVALTILVGGAFLLLAPAPALPIDLHVVTSYQPNTGGSVTDVFDIITREPGPPPPPMPGPDDGFGDRPDPHKITSFQAHTGGSVTDVFDIISREPGPPPPPMPDEWDGPPLFGPGSVVPDGFGDGAFDAPSLGPVAPPNDFDYGDTPAIPEPATLTLLALGGLAVLRRRR